MFEIQEKQRFREIDNLLFSKELLFLFQKVYFPNKNH